MIEFVGQTDKHTTILVKQIVVTSKFGIEVVVKIFSNNNVNIVPEL